MASFNLFIDEYNGLKLSLDNEIRLLANKLIEDYLVIHKLKKEGI